MDEFVLVTGFSEAQYGRDKLSMTWCSFFFLLLVAWIIMGNSKNEES